MKDLGNTLNTLVQAMWSTTLELSPWLLVGMLVAGVLHVVLPQSFVRRHLGNGIWGVIKAVLLGIPLPLCSCGVIPAGVGLRRDGASRGSAIGFIIATPQTGVDSVLVSASFLGWPFALFKVLTALLTGLIGGFITDAVHKKDAAPIVLPNAPIEGAARRSWRAGLSHAVEILETIWLWVVFGIAASAVIQVFVPTSFFAETVSGPMAFVAVLLIALPLYICATASVPIAAALVAQGLPAGAALVFLLAGPATNLATMGAIRRAFGNRSLAVYLSTITLGSVGFGMAFDSVLPSGGTVATHMHNAMSGSPWWAMASAVVFIALLTWFLLSDVWRLFKARSLRSRQAITLNVSGMTCNDCVRKIENAVYRLQGVDEVVVARSVGTVTVEGQAAKAAIAKTIEGVGFRVTNPIEPK